MKLAKTIPQVLRWIARVIGALILAFVLLHLLGEGLPNAEVVTPGEGLL